MKPISLSLIIYGKNGVVPLRTYPNKVSKKNLEKISMVGLPYGAMEGDFITGNLEKYTFASYLFLVNEEGINYLSALVAIFEKGEIRKDFVKENLSDLVKKIRTLKFDTFEEILNNLPEIYKECCKGSFTFKTTTTVTLSIESVDKKKKKHRNEIEIFGNDIWEEDTWKEDEEEKEENKEESKLNLN